MADRFLKAAGETKDYVIDWTSELGSDTISTSTWSVPTGLTSSLNSKTDKTATGWVSGGTVGTTYTVTNTIVTAGARTMVKSFQIIVDDPTSHYVTLQDVKNGLPDDKFLAASKYDAFLVDAAIGASRSIDAHCHVRTAAFQAASVASARYYEGSGEDQQWIDDCVQVTEVGVDETGSGTYTTWTENSDFITWPYNRDTDEPICRLDINFVTLNKAVWYSYQRSVKVTAKWGRCTTPPQWVKDATLITALRRFKRAMQAYQDTGAIVELGQLTYVQPLDPEVAALIRAKGFGGPSL